MEQNGRNKKAMRILAFAGFLMLAAGIGSLSGRLDTKVVTYLVSMAVAMLFVDIIIFRRKRGEPITDERTKKIGRVSMTYSWWSTYVLMAVLMLVEEFGLAKLTVSGVLGLTFFFMVASQYLLRWYLNQKADVE